MNVEMINPSKLKFYNGFAASWFTSAPPAASLIVNTEDAKAAAQKVMSKLFKLKWLVEAPHDVVKSSHAVLRIGRNLTQCPMARHSLLRQESQVRRATGI